MLADRRRRRKFGFGAREATGETRQMLLRYNLSGCLNLKSPIYMVLLPISGFLVKGVYGDFTALGGISRRGFRAFGLIGVKDLGSQALGTFQQVWGLAWFGHTNASLCSMQFPRTSVFEVTVVGRSNHGKHPSMQSNSLLQSTTSGRSCINETRQTSADTKKFSRSCGSYFLGRE